MAPPTFGTEILPLIDQPKDTRTPKEKCEAKGGFWDEETQTCILAKIKKDEPTPVPPVADVTTPEVIKDQDTGKITGVRLPDGRSFFGSPKEIRDILAKYAEKTTLPPGSVPSGTAQRTAELRAEGEQLAGGVGQFGQLPISPTGLDVGEAATVGVIGAIPRALSLAAGGAALGAIAGTAVLPGIGTAGGAAIGAVGGFVSGLASSMIGNFKSQRTDTTTAQQRVLDEGKQTLMDWVTLARADPTNRMFYLAQFNKQSAQIDQAHRQMKLDTSRDLAKFETALPNLAEFNAFYSEGGERDSLNNEMRNALLASPPPDYDLFELADRKKNNDKI